MAVFVGPGQTMEKLMARKKAGGQPSGPPPPSHPPPPSGPPPPGPPPGDPPPMTPMEKMKARKAAQGR
jgi:hypothetical protein